MKKVKFRDVKLGSYFKYWGACYIKNGWCHADNIKKADGRFFDGHTFVTPVELKIWEVE